MAPKADKKVKDKKGEDINLNEGPPAVQLHEEKETQTEPEKSALKKLCCGSNKPKPAAPDSTSTDQGFCSWFPCFCRCSKTDGVKTDGVETTEQQKPCICVKKCSDKGLAESIEQLKKMAAQSDRYPLTVAELLRGLHGIQDEIEEEPKSNEPIKQEEKQPEKQISNENKPEEMPGGKLACLTKHHKADCPCASRSIWTEFLRPPRPKKVCRHCKKPQ